MNQIEQRTMKKVFRRLVPFLMFCYFFNFLDRVNVSFAALDMNKDLGFSASVFGFGSGILFLAYMLCETPSNVLLTRFGARKWLARIMVSWGIIASSMTETVFPQDAVDRLVPMKRAGTPEEVADLIGFLASEQAAYISGQIISINGAMI